MTFSLTSPRRSRSLRSVVTYHTPLREQTASLLGIIGDFLNLLNRPLDRSQPRGSPLSSPLTFPSFFLSRDPAGFQFPKCFHSFSLCFVSRVELRKAEGTLLLLLLLLSTLLFIFQTFPRFSRRFPPPLCILELILRGGRTSSRISRSVFSDYYLSRGRRRS